MKIQKTNSFSISINKTGPGTLKNLKKGSRISAQILEKLNLHDAILDIAGNRTRVKFLKGVPDNKKIFLILEDIIKNKYYFKLLDKSNSFHILKEIADYSIFDLDDLKKNNAAFIYNSIRNGFPGIFSLNSIFLQLIHQGDFKKEKKLSQLFNRLMKLGFNKKDLFFLSLLLNTSNRSINFDIILTFLINFKFTGYDKFAKENKLLKNEELLRERIGNIIEKINLLIDKDSENKYIIKDLIDTIITRDPNEKNNGLFSNEITFFEDNEYKSIKYIYYKNSILFSFHLSFLGDLEILIKIQKNNCNISIFCKNDDKIKILKNEIKELKSDIEDYTENNINIFFHNMENVTKKIIEIYYSLKLINNIDIKV